MKKILIPALACLMATNFYAQEILSPREIYKLLEDSYIMYELHEFQDTIELYNRSHLVNGNAYFREDGIVMEYERDDTTHTWYGEGEILLLNEEYEAARQMFRKVMERKPELHLMLNRIAVSHFAEGQIDSALIWFQHAVEYNPIDSESWVYLAGIYFSMDEQEKALDAIAHAMILNRNHPTIQNEFETILNYYFLDGSNWMFNPQFRIDSISERMVHVYFNIQWMGYALAKAAWWYEPGYADSKGPLELDRRLLEEKESLVMLYAMLNEDMIRENPEFYALHLALHRNYLNEYILFEILLPDYPELGLLIRPEPMEALKRYVLEIRGGLEPQ